ncbi:unnamed protein product [Rodentolepis nana]|uniref:REM-1 domain-containing protein n=1 Tax=Rodentolepis nana TaxID=102285 RepID=A0A0R3T1K8_RODNA|nr:unnamed protein product [Rodentolepis nana]
MDYTAYLNSLSSQYGLKTSSVKDTIQQLQDKLNQDKIKLQQLFKEKLITPKSSKKYTSHIKQLNEQIKDLSEDIGELDTCLLILRHKLPSEILRAMRDDATSNAQIIASIQKALDIEIRVRYGAERLCHTYKDGPKEYLELAKRQLDGAESKIGFLRNQLARLKHASQSDESGSVISSAEGAVCVSPTFSDTSFLNSAYTGGVIPPLTWQQQVADMKYRLRIERAVYEGAGKVLNAFIGPQKSAEKSPKLKLYGSFRDKSNSFSEKRAEAYLRLREYFQELYLLQLSMQNLISVPPPMGNHENNPQLAAAFAEAINDPEIQQLLEHPDNKLESSSLSPAEGIGVRKHSISSMATPAITSVTGLLEVRCIGCEGLLETFPGEIVNMGSSPSPKKRPLVNSLREYSARFEDRPGTRISYKLFFFYFYLSIWQSSGFMLSKGLRRSVQLEVVITKFNSLLLSSKWLIIAC